MDAVIKKWGNSPALRLNATAMRLAAFDLEQRVTISASKGRIVIEPAEPMDASLEDLIAGITPENLHKAVDFGEPVGKEAL